MDVGGSRHHAISLQDLPLPPNQPNWIVDSVSEWAAQWAWALPWVQFWGQMSDYAGDCCYPEYALHERYLDCDPTLIELAGSLRASGLRVGYYASPDWLNPVAGAMDDPAGVAFVQDWIDINTGDNADAYYVDVIGRVVTGQPDIVMSHFDAGGLIPTDGFIEGIVDIYPGAHLLTGATVGCCGFNTLSPGTVVGWPPGPNVTPHMMLPRMASYLLPDRVTFLGGGNGEAAQWGAANDHVVEREAFLIGSKMIAFNPDEPDGAPNPLLVAIVNAREEARWWQRRPLFRDTRGLGSLPNDVRAAVFVDQSGRRLIAVDNPQQVAGETLVVEGMRVAIPSDVVSILEPCSDDLDGDLVVGVLDLLELLSGWGPCQTVCPTDLNGDGRTDVLDILELLSAWGPCK